MKKCHICGLMKKTTFNCSKCGKRICLACFIFDDNLCIDCMTLNYSEKYAGKIEEYAKGVLSV